MAPPSAEGLLDSKAFRWFARTVRTAAALVVFLGLSNAGLTIWMLSKIMENGTRIESVRAELIDKISMSQRDLTKEITSLREEFVAVRSALGESPQRIQEAALSIEQRRDEMIDLIRQLDRASTSIINLDSNLQQLSSGLETVRNAISNEENGLVSQVEQISDSINNEEQGLLLRVERIESILDLLSKHFDLGGKPQ